MGEGKRKEKGRERMMAKIHEEGNSELGDAPLKYLTDFQISTSEEMRFAPFCKVNTLHTQS